MAIESGAVRERPRLRELDLLRFVAAAAVMLHHYTGVSSTVWGGRDARAIYPELAPVGHFGWLGVELFFLISGFVILMSAWGRTPGEFAVSRIVRLYPAYWFSVLLSVGLFLLLGTSGPHRPEEEGSPVVRMLPNLTMLHEGLGVRALEVVYWTLWIELHFYVLIALLVWRGITYGRAVTFMVVWLLAGVYAQEAGNELLQTALITSWAPYFIAGMAFYLIHRFGSDLLLWLLIGLCWVLSVHYALDGTNWVHQWPGVHEIVVPAVLTAFYALMALVALHKLTWMNWRGLTVMGALTYPLYLLHEIVARAIVAAFFPDPVADRLVILPILLAAALGSAYAVYRFVERPTQKVMRRRLLAALHRVRKEPTPPPVQLPRAPGLPGLNRYRPIRGLGPFPYEPRPTTGRRRAARARRRRRSPPSRG